MNLRRHVTSLGTSLVGALVVSAAAHGQGVAASHADAFDRLLTLEGIWDVREVGNESLQEVARYTRTGRGSVLIEDLRDPNAEHGHMLTAYHMDLDELVMTHFCGAGNQPRMRAVEYHPDDDRIVFEFYDITDLEDPDDYHSRAVEVVFHGDDRVDLVYDGRVSGESTRQVFQMHRRSGGR